MRVFVPALALAGGQAMAADTVVLTGGGPNNGGAFDALVDLGDDGVNDLSFETFCLEKDEYFNPGKEYVINITDRAVGGGGNDEGNLGYDKISEATAWLFQEWSRAGNGALSGVGEGDVQQALWVLEDEMADSAMPASVFSLLDSHESEWLGQGVGNVRVMQLWDGVDADGNYYGNHQDQLILVPMPVPAAMATAGLLGLGMIRRRRSA